MASDAKSKTTGFAVDGEGKSSTSCQSVEANSYRFKRSLCLTAVRHQRGPIVTDQMPACDYISKVPKYEY